MDSSRIWATFFASIGLVYGGVCACIVYVLTGIECVGLMAIGRSRGYRITNSTAWAIVNHASVGWLIFGICFGVASFFHIHAEMMSFPDAFEESPLFGSMAILTFWGDALLLFGAIPGFLFFETFAYLGLRRCKYANTLPTKERADG